MNKSEAYKAGWRASEIGYLEDLSEIIGMSHEDATEFAKGYQAQKNRELLEGVLFACAMLLAIVALSVFVIRKNG